MRRAIVSGDDVVEDRAITVDRGRHVAGRDAVGVVLDRLLDLAGGEELAHDLAIVAFERDGIVEVIATLDEHAPDELVEVRQRLLRVLGELLLDRAHLAFPLVPVEPGLHACVLHGTEDRQTRVTIAR